MRLINFLRLSLLGPLILPPILWAMPIAPLATFGVVLSVGLTYYAIGYALFAVGALFWLGRPRDPADLWRAVFLAPLLCAPLTALSVTGIGLVLGTGHRADIPRDLATWCGVTIALGYPYCLGLRGMAKLLRLTDPLPSSHAV